jgi:hypothetical protein
MKKITFLFTLLIAFGYSTYAQVSAYSFSETTEAYAQITGTTSTATGDDGSQNTVAIGFTFNYEGTDYTDFSINTNGFIRLGTTIGGSPWTNSLGNAAAQRPLIAPFWDDNNMTGGEIRYAVTGTSPNQVLTVNWHNSKIGGGGSTASSAVSTLLRLYETTNVIEFVYSNPYTTANTVTASVGLNGASSFLSVTPAVASTVSSGTANNAINATVMANLAGKKLIFTPPTPCSGTPVAGTVAPATQTLLVGQTPAALIASGYSSGVSGLTFQWQESPDDATWVNAVGGTGATTASYTPPVFASTIYYRLVVTCTPSAMSANTASVVLNACGNFSVPALEDFTTYVPGCWQEADNGDLTAGPATFGTSAWIADGFGNVGTTGAMRINIDATGDNDWILSPLYTIPVTGYELKFDASANQWASVNAPTTAWEADDFVEVLVSTGTTNWTVLYTFNDTNVPSNIGTPTIIDLDAYAGMDVRFAFRGVEGAANGGADIEFIVDNFEIRLTPACVEPTTLAAANITASSVDLSWVDPSGVQFDFEYAIQVVGTGVPAGPGVAIADVSVIGETLDVNGNALTANTTYEFYVRADCGGGGFSTWAGPFNFTTLCATYIAPYTETFENTGTIPSCWNMSGSENWRFSNTGTGNHIGNNGTITGTTTSGGYFAWVDDSTPDTSDATLTSPMIDVSALTTPRLTFFELSNNEGVANSTLNVEVWDGAAWNAMGTYNTNTAGWEKRIIDLSTLTITGDVQVRFIIVEAVANFYDDIAIDDVTIEETPSCLEPTTLAATNITASSVDLSWIDPTGTQFDFEYAIQAAGTGIPAGTGTAIGATSVTGETFDVNGNPIASATTYEVYVRADCGGGDFSAWVGPINFTTSTEVICGTPVNTTHCYDNNDATTWTFTSSDGSPLRITFNAGQIESCCDDILIYDGTSNTGTLLYQGNNGGDLTGLTFDSTSDSIYVEINSDSSVSCASGSYTTSWDFTVVCATCVNPTATYTVVPDCVSGQFSIDVDVTALGTATSLTITDGVAPLTMISALGIQTFGPYADGASTTITLTNEQDAGCSISSGSLTYVCPPVNDACGTPTVLTPGGVFTDNPVVGTNVGTTDSAETTSACGGYSGGDVWYQVTVPASGNITIETATNGTTFDTVLAVFSGTCGSLTEVDCSDDATGVYSLVSLTAMTPGEVLLVNVYEYGNNNFGTFQVSAYDASLSSNSFDSNSFVAYPNPVKDILNLEYNSEISSVKILNLLGQEVISKIINANATQVDMSQLSAGAYIVNVTIGDAVKTIKVVKQ